MNLAMTITMAAVISVLPALENPIQGVSVCAGGIEIATSPDGLVASTATSSDFTLTIELTDGTPVRVRL